MEYRDAIRSLVETFPEISSHYKDSIAGLYANENPHVFYGSIFVNYIGYIADNFKKSKEERFRTLLLKCFAFIEKILSSRDFETRCLGETSVLEALLGEEGGLELFAPFMGSETRRIALEIAQRWELDTGLLS